MIDGDRMPAASVPDCNALPGESRDDLGIRSEMARRRTRDKLTDSPEGHGHEQLISQVFAYRRAVYEVIADLMHCAFRDALWPRCAMVAGSVNHW